jgi:hypothetical protein
VGKFLLEATHRARIYENEFAAAQKEIKHLSNLVDYYKGATQTSVYLKDDFGKVYDEFKKERHLLISNIAEF